MVAIEANTEGVVAAETPSCVRLAGLSSGYEVASGARASDARAVLCDGAGGGYGVRVTGYGELFICTRLQVRTDPFEVGCDAGFHLNLDLAIAWIDVVEEFLAGLAGVGLYFVVQILRNMADG